MSKISDIFFHDVFLDIFLDSGYCNSFKVSKKCLKYIESIKGLIGIHVFDQVSIDNSLKSIIFDKSACLELSIVFLKMASIYEGVQVFQYINDEYYLPYIVLSVDGCYVVCNDYCFIDDVLMYLDRSLWIVDINDVNVVSSKYNLSILNNIEYIDINDFYTITDVLAKIDLCDCSMIGGNDISFDLAVSLGVKYVLIDSKSDIKKFFDIINILNEY